MKLDEIYSQKNMAGTQVYKWVQPKISFEIFPPKNDVEELFSELEILIKLNPEFISLTYGATGGCCDDFYLLKRLKLEFDFDIMPHLTCICNTKSAVLEHLKLFKSLNIDKILALRGDIPKDKEIMHEFMYANELVGFVRTNSDLSIAVAGYPEAHIECGDLYQDIENLKKKVDAGASAIFTQLFFDNDKYFSFVQLVRDAGINVPIIAGVMPILNEKQVFKMTNLANISVPKTLMKRIEKFRDSPSDMQKFGVEFASYQVQQLIDAEISGLHFYTLNKAKSTCEILENIGG
ncbi:MAG: methylenetetrahydrofolate reductase [Candidatus Gastranaerophilales bacterium]